MQKKFTRAFSFFLFVSLLVFTGPVHLTAQTAEDSGEPAVTFEGIPVPVVSSKAAVVIDEDTGTVLFTKNPDLEIPPASLTKLMTIYLALSEVKAGTISLDQEIIPPRESWAINQPPRSSLMFLADGQRTTLRELLLGLAVPSGNDAAIAVALAIAPTVRDFTDMMNNQAQALGLENTHFDEPSGISEFNMTTAEDFARFCRIYIQTFPEALQEFHSVPEFAYPKAENVAPVFRSRPGTIVQRNNNRLLGTVEGVDGLKTGYIDESGYNLAVTAQRGDSRFIAVILGGSGDQMRNQDGKTLINWAFSNFQTIKPQEPELEAQRIWKGKTDYVGIRTDDPLDFTATADRAAEMYTKTEITNLLIAPLPAGSRVGDLVYYDSMGELRRVPLVTSADIEKGGFFKEVYDSIRLLFLKK
ncbi:MAG: D-alanyl-D-alanine carboxypeptidase [Treponema sp.]|nr:D-alanyl-D-alanine carboxypeptidase [Treponema sp.]